MSVRYITYLAPIALAACGGGGSGSGTGGAPGPVATSTATPTPTPSATASPSPAPSPSPSPSPSPTTFAAQVAALYDVAPNPTTCSPGTLKASVKAQFLADLNRIRALHNLPAVTYSSAEDQQSADSSMIMAVNRSLSHTPPTGWTCYSASGNSGAGSSNLIGGWGSGLGFDTEDDYLALWLNEGGSADIGHRRWILSPFLGKTAYGRVAYQSASGDRVSTGTMRVFSFTGGVTVPAGIPAFVAYPFGDYPIRYFRPGDYLSFTAVPNTSNNFANNTVRYTSATITVTGPSGALPVSNVSSDTDGYGVPNNVQWRVAGLQSNVTYTVQISGVTGSTQSSYTYSFRIVP